MLLRLEGGITRTVAVFEYGLRWMSVLIDLALVQNRRGYSGDLSQANPRMAGGSPQHHLGWLGYCLAVVLVLLFWPHALK